ncbi:MAG: response regulator [Pseudomonadota bacterium]
MAAQASSVKQSSKIFVVAVVGVSEADLKILSRIFNITRYRQRCYKLIAVDENSSMSDLAEVKAADIQVVNVNSAAAVRCWQGIASSINIKERRPVLKISNVTPTTAAGSEFTISWPINPAKMLQVLDSYTIRHLHYYPEFAIGSELEPCSTTLKNIKAINATTRAKQQDVNTQKTIRVLVADDSLAVRRQLKIEFDIMDAKLNLVADGEAAVKAAEEEQYDVIFLDVVMPGMDGYSVCKNIRRSRLNKKTPVVMLTSRSSSFDKLKGVLAGCDTYLTKPINHNEFTEITQKHLNKNMEKNQ